MPGWLTSMAWVIAAMSCIVATEGTPHLFHANRFHSLLLVELLYRLSFRFFLADKHSVEMSDLPQLGVHGLVLIVDQLELREEIFVLYSEFEVILKEIHGLMDLDSEFLQQSLEAIELNKPLVSVSNVSFTIFRSHRPFKVKSVHIIIGSFELSFLELHWEIFVSIDARSVTLQDSLFVYFLQNRVAVRNGGNEYSSNQQVREYWS